MISKLDTSKIVQVRLKETQYYQEEFPKKQIVLHHTVSNGNAKSVMNWWASTPAKIGVAFIIDRDGIIHQCFSSKHWAHHLGTKAKNNKQLNQQSIGIELCSWGGLTIKENPMLKGNPKFFSSTGTEVPKEEVVKLDLPFRGYLYFQKYTSSQLNSLQILVNYLCETYGIPKSYNSDMWDYSRMAMNGNPGIYTHVSFRKDKSDCFPQREVIDTISDTNIF
jgi:N-acetyl-anhydromuramyl-L-alanine amidase AmpD